jgi:hypothetical protein
MVWIAQDEDGMWKWCVGAQSGGDPMYLSTNSFKTSGHAKQNAKITLNGKNIQFVMADQKLE